MDSRFECMKNFVLGAVYITTEDSVPVSRTIDIASYFKKRFPGAVAHINFSDNIFIDEVFTEVVIQFI